MTAVTDIPGRAAGRRRGLLVALLLSLTLNVFIIGGLAWSMRAAPPPGPAQRLLAIARTLDLSPDQRAALRTFGATARELNRSLRDSDAPLMQQLWDEMGKPQPDGAQLARLAEQSVGHRLDFQKKMAAGLMTFLATLSPEQRRAFVTQAAQRPPDGRRILRLVVP